MTTKNHDAAPTRRQFLTGLAVAGAATTALPAFAARKPIVGRGEHTYECLHDWLTPPPNILWGDTQGVAEDAAGRLYVTHTVHPDSPSPDAIVVFDKHGKFLTSWGARFRGGGHGLDLRREGNEEFLYHCDTAHRQIVKTRLNGEVVWEKGLPAESGVYKDNPYVPTNIAFSPNGDFYVADGYGSDYIHQYSLRGDYIRTFGGRGKEPGKFSTAHGLWLDTRRKFGGEPALVITDRTNSRLQYFSLDGKNIPEAVTSEGMRRPCQCHVRGDLMVVADLDSVVTILDKRNRIVARLGDGHPSNLRGRPRSEYIPGKFVHPHDAQFLRNGDILVAEWLPTGRITRLRRIG